MATHLYLAILTDTGSFRFSHLTPRPELAGRAVAAGADRDGSPHALRQQLAGPRASQGGVERHDRARRRPGGGAGNHQADGRRTRRVVHDTEASSTFPLGEGHRGRRVLQGDGAGRLARQPAVERGGHRRESRGRSRWRRAVNASGAVGRGRWPTATRIAGLLAAAVRHEGGRLVVDKPEGPTPRHRRPGPPRRLRSDDRPLRDPGPDGHRVLVLAVGAATRLVRYLTADEKQYDATMRFGCTTDSYDRTGDRGRGGARPTREAVEAALERFRGPIRQVPPPIRPEG